MDRKMKGNVFRSFIIFLILILIITAIPVYGIRHVNAETIQTNTTNAKKMKRQELLYKRTLNSKTFLNKDGTYTTEISEQPIHYETKNHQLEDIDNNLTLDSTGNSFKNKANSYVVNFTKQSAYNGSLINVNQGKKSINLLFDNKNQNKVTGQVENNSINYPDILPNTDFKYWVAGNRIKEDIFLKDKPTDDTLNGLKFKLNISGMEVKENGDGGLSLVDKGTKKEQFYIEAPFMYDSYKPSGYQANPQVNAFPEEAISRDVQLKWSVDNDTLNIHIVPSKEWLDDSKRIYPVVIDPTLVNIQDSTNVEDTNVRSGFPTTTGGNDTDLGAGLSKDSTSSNVIRALLKFNVDSIPDDTMIISADLDLWMSQVKNDTPINIGLYEVSKDWEENQASWNYAKQTPSTPWTTKGGDYKTTPLDEIDQISALTDLSFNYKWKVSTDLVKKWVNDSSVNYGLLLKSQSETTNTYKKFVSSENSIDTKYHPLLVVTYKTVSRLGLENYWDYDSHPLVGGSSYTNLTTGNNVIQYQDFYLPSRGGFSLDFTRTYNAKSLEKTAFGYGWTATGLESLFIDNNQNIIYYTDDDGTTHTFTYDSANNLYKSDPGTYLTIKHGTSYELQDKDGEKEEFEINEQNDNTSMQIARPIYREDRHGNRINYEYNANNQLIKISSILTSTLAKSIQFTYNTNGYVDSVTYEGSLINFTYDIDGKLIEVKQLQGNNTYSTTTFEYKNNFLSAIIDPNGRRTDFTYQNEFLSKVQEPLEINGVKDPSDRPGTEYSIDKDAKTAIITNPEGNQVTYYTNENYVTIKKVDSDGVITTYSLDSNYNPISIVEDGKTTSNSYDGNGNLLTTKDSENHLTTYTYTTFSNVKTMTDSNNNMTTYNYYPNGDLQNIQNPDGGVESYQYDSYGDLQSITHPDGSIENVSYDYESTNKTSENIDPFLNKTTSVTDHQNNLIQKVDGKGNQFTFSYDPKNELKTVTDPKQYITSYDYDDNGNITSITNAKNSTYKYEYDGQNHVKKETNQLNQETVYDYDENGNLIKTTLPNGRTIINHYDYSVDQLTNVEINGTIKWGYEYDSSGNVITVCQGESPCQSQSTDVLRNISYNVDGSIDTIVDRGNKIKYTDLGTKQTVQYTTNSVATTLDFSLNNMNKLSSIVRNGDSKQLVSFDYNQSGLPTTVLYKNGASIEMNYVHNRLDKYVVKNSSSNTFDTYTYDYDANNRITHIYSNDGVTTYTYDNQLDQLKNEQLPDGTTISYNYDEVGNRISKSTTKLGVTATVNYNFNDANQLISDGNNSYQYDENGNLKSDGLRTYIFNDLNQLEEIKDQNGQTIASYTYDEDGKRISSTTSKGTIRYFYDGDKVLYEADGSNNILREYTYNETGQPTTITMNGNTYYYLFNQHGDVIALTDSNGNIVASYSYDAWGNILSQTGSMASENPYRYAGYRYDEDIKLYYLMARYYNSDIGVFLSLDPSLGDNHNPISLNGYNYANNNPITNIDPDGDFAELIGIYFIPGIGEVALGVTLLGGASWLVWNAAAHLPHPKMKVEIPRKLLKEKADGEVVVDIGEFDHRVSGQEWENKKTGWTIERDKSKSNSHGGSYWKLKDSKGKRKATLDKHGKILRK